ncbi:MAG: glycosyltransferase [Myxococcota bacterium]
MILGGGPLEGELRARIERLGHGSDRVELPGRYPRRRRGGCSRKRPSSQPCVVASDGDRDGVRDGDPRTMALGVPVVSTDVTGIPEVVRDGRTGVLVPQADPNGWPTRSGN